MARHPPPPLPRVDRLLHRAAPVECGGVTIDPVRGAAGRRTWPPDGSVDVGAICALAFGDRGLEVGVVDGLGGRGDVCGPRVAREEDAEAVVAMRCLGEGALADGLDEPQDIVAGAGANDDALGGLAGVTAE